MKNMEHEAEVHRVYRLRLKMESQFWQKLFNYGCSKLIIRKIFDETTRNCLGCQVDHPSQTRQECLYITLSEQKLECILMMFIIRFQKKMFNNGFQQKFILFIILIPLMTGCMRWKKIMKQF